MEVSLETTRRDQARAQFAFLGHSVCGDYRYGPLARLESLGTSAASASASASASAGTGAGAMHDSTEGGGGEGVGVGSGVIDEKELERQIALHDPLRRLGLHFSELRLTHPTTNSALTLTSSCPASFTDLMRRSQGSSRASLVQFKSAVPDISSTAGRVSDTHSASAGESRGAADRTRGSDGQHNKGGHKSVEVEGEDGDGRMDSLRSGSTQYASESASSSSEKVKVFTLSEFLGPGKVRGAGRDKRQERDQQGPPPSSKTVFRRK
jgi:hypothetical protein